MSTNTNEGKQMVFSSDVMNELQSLLEELKSSNKITNYEFCEQWVDIYVQSPTHLEVVRFLKEHFTHLHTSTVTGYDDGKEHFSVIYNLLGDFKIPINVIVSIPRVPPSEKAELPTLTTVLPSANVYEREITDLFGIEFKGHPHPYRLILPDSWPENEFPLRKDYQIKSPRPRDM